MSNQSNQSNQSSTKSGTRNDGLKYKFEAYDRVKYVGDMPRSYARLNGPMLQLDFAQTYFVVETSPDRFDDVLISESMNPNLSAFRLPKHMFELVPVRTRVPELVRAEVQIRLLGCEVVAQCTIATNPSKTKAYAQYTIPLDGQEFSAVSAWVQLPADCLLDPNYVHRTVAAAVSRNKLGRSVEPIIVAEALVDAARLAEAQAVEAARLPGPGTHCEWGEP